MAEHRKGEEVLAALGEANAFGGKPLVLWEQALAAVPADFLPDAAAIRALRADLGLPAERDPLLVEMAERVKADPDLLALARYLHWSVFLAPQQGTPWGAPSLSGRLGDKAGLFYLLLALAFGPALRACHRGRGYPEAVTRQTLAQPGWYDYTHLKGAGRPGLYERQLPWLSVYLRDFYVRLGRLEFQLHPYNGGVTAWKRADGAVLALAEDGVRVDDQGYRLPEAAPAGTGWTTRLTETDGSVTGNPVHPEGRILREARTLPKAEWTLMFKKGTSVLDLHIPSGGGLSPEAVQDSFRQALDFFPRHHPDLPFAALVCVTWFMDPQLAGLLPAESNMLRFQRAVYLYPPVPGNALWFVFQADPLGDLAKLPRDTSLRRTLADFLARGGIWRGGGMFVLREHMAEFSEKRYRWRSDQ